MVKKYIYGTTFETEAIVNDVEAESGAPAFGTVSLEDGFSFTYHMGAGDAVYGLGENVRGINKRGFEFISDCSDNPHHLEDCKSLYGAHNFLIVSGEQLFGLFLDYPSRMSFDVGYTKADELKISCEHADLKLYVFTGATPEEIVKQFRKMIGRSYIPPKFAFGFGQSRWGYKCPEDFEKVANEHREAGVPIDMIYMDIDYMDRYMDFTVDEKKWPDFPKFVADMKAKNIRLVPIIDAGVKIEKGYSVYEEGVEKGYFCKREDGSDFVAEVWPGWTHFPDVLNADARKWFGDKYKILLDAGIEGFWNDMNEPAIFKTPEGVAKVKKAMQEFIDAPDETNAFAIQGVMGMLANNPADYRRFYHNVNGKKVCHADVHNLFGYNMTRAAGEAFERICPDKRILMFSRSSYVGMHRYGGIWQGDNFSWWSHLLMNLKMMPALNMVGLLYTGADLGGFGSNTSRDLVLRWLALAVFTPLMRNHSALGTREQEFYQFEGTEDFKHVIGVRYRLLPYLYSEYMKAALRDDMMFRPLAFVYPEDEIAAEIEDQMMLGNELMIAPVCTQNASGRFVYLPEEMMLVKFTPAGLTTEVLPEGSHYVKVALNEVALFVRAGKAIPVAKAAEYVDAVDYGTIQMVGFAGASYELYNDDGFSKDYDKKENITVLRN